MTCTATDAHHNTVTRSFKVTVNYGWAGCFQPVDNPPTFNTVKAGRAIPVKFSLTGTSASTPSSAASVCLTASCSACHCPVESGTATRQLASVCSVAKQRRVSQSEEAG